MALFVCTRSCVLFLLCALASVSAISLEVTTEYGRIRGHDEADPGVTVKRSISCV